jgi:hypothetical protein
MRSFPAPGDPELNSPKYSSLRRKGKKIGNAAGQHGAIMLPIAGYSLMFVFSDPIW